MRLLTLIAIIITLYSCGHSNDRRPSIIDKEAQFLHVSLKISAKNKQTIFADLSILNTSKDSILLYRPLFPFNDKIGWPCFSIFNAKTYDQVSFSRPIGKFKTYDPYDDGETIIIPENDPAKFFPLRGGDSITFHINLGDWYNFKPYESGEQFNVVPSISNPFVSFDFNQQYEKDSVDGQIKPVFYFISLPQKADVDSMRVRFTLP